MSNLFFYQNNVYSKDQTIKHIIVLNVHEISNTCIRKISVVSLAWMIND